MALTEFYHRNDSESGGLLTASALPGDIGTPGEIWGRSGSWRRLQSGTAPSQVELVV